MISSNHIGAGVIGWWLLLLSAVFTVFSSTPLFADEVLLKVDTRFGSVSVIKDSGDCVCGGNIKFGSDQIEISSTGSLYASLEGTFQTPEGDVVILSVPRGAKNVPPNYYVLLISGSKMSDLADHDRFTSGDGTFRATQKGNEIFFDLGWDKRKRKTAFYRSGVVYVGSNNAATQRGLAKKDCGYVLTQLSECRKECPSDGFMSNSVHGNFNALEQQPVFKTSKFFEICEAACKGQSVSTPHARSMLCGY